LQILKAGQIWRTVAIAGESITPFDYSLAMAAKQLVDEAGNRFAIWPR
jgi:hypothetical protein